MLFVALNAMCQKAVHYPNTVSVNTMKNLVFAVKRNRKLPEAQIVKEGAQEMSLMEQLNQDMKQSMKNKEKEKLSVIRMVKASLQNEMIRLGKNKLSEDEELTILSRELKQRKDSLQEYKSAGRNDIVENLESEIIIIQKYMPEQLTDTELEDLIQATIKEINATSKKEMGKVMSAIMPKVKGKADGSRINKLVLQHLN